MPSPSTTNGLNHSAASLWLVVVALGVTQIIGYGTLYYAYAILAPAIAREFAVGPSHLFAILSVGLLLGGFAAPRVGRAMDRYGAPSLMALGSAASAVLLVVLALAPGIVVFAVTIVLIEIVSVVVLYDAAFACLAFIGGMRARRAITHLTLIAGFASTLFWPLTGWLLDLMSWRSVYVLFALLHLGMALPLHVWIARRTTSAAIVPVGPAEDKTDPVVCLPLLGGEVRFAFWSVAISFALSGVLISAISVHLVGILQTIGLGTASFAASMLMGPAQVLIRLTDALFWRGLHPLTVAVISVAALPLAVLVLMGVPAAVATGAAFAVLFGIGQGLKSIVQGTVPLVLFGREGYAERLGRIAAVRIVLGASAPFAFSAAQETVGLQAALALLLGIGVVAMLPLLLLRHHLASSGRLKVR